MEMFHPTWIGGENPSKELVWIPQRVNFGETHFVFPASIYKKNPTKQQTHNDLGYFTKNL